MLVQTPMSLIHTVYSTYCTQITKWLNPGVQTLIKKDLLGDCSPEKDCCLPLMFRQPVQKPSPESSLLDSYDGFFTRFGISVLLVFL